MSTTAIIILVVVTVIGLIIISIYNGLIRKKNEVDNAFGGMDVQLKKRYDLIPNLISTVKEYMTHERELLSKVTELRSKAINPGISSEERVDLDNQKKQEKDYSLNILFALAVLSPHFCWHCTLPKPMCFSFILLWWQFLDWDFISFL